MSRPALAERAKRRVVLVGALLAWRGARALLQGPARQLLVLGGAGVTLAGAYAAARKLGRSSRGTRRPSLAFAQPESRPPIRRIGHLETAISTLFAVLAEIGLGMPPLA